MLLVVKFSLLISVFHSFFPLSPLCHDRWKGALIIPEGWEINDCLWSRPGPWTTLEAKHVICNCWSKTFTLLQKKKKEKWGGWLLGKRKWYLCLLPFVYQGILSHFPPFFFIFTNSFQWLSNWKMEMLLLPSISAAASWQQSNFLSSGINGIEQYILIKKKRKERKKAHDCWPSCLSSTDQILSFKTDHCAVRPNNVAY